MKGLSLDTESSSLVEDSRMSLDIRETDCQSVYMADRTEIYIKSFKPRDKSGNDATTEDKCSR